LISDDCLNETIEIVKGLVEEKKEDEFSESRDISFIDFISQIPQNPQKREFISLSKLTADFKEFLQEDESEDKWLNPKWTGRALKRLNLIGKKRRLTKGREVIPDIDKAAERIKFFKSEDKKE
jgi:hypothetical protein